MTVLNKEVKLLPTKTLRKAVMKRFSLEHKYDKTPSNDNNKAYRKQTNLCSRLYKKGRKKYYAHLDIRNITDNKKFWKTVKPLFSERTQNVQKVTIIKDGNLLSINEEVSEIK